MSLFGSGPVAARESSGPYDTIAFPGPSGENKTLTRAEFEKLSLVDRVRLLAGGHLRFFRGDEEVSSQNAMARR